MSISQTETASQRIRSRAVAEAADEYRLRHPESDARTSQAVRNDTGDRLPDGSLDWSSWLAQPPELRDEWQPGQPALFLPGVRKVTDLWGGLSPDEIMMRICQKWEKGAVR